VSICLAARVSGTRGGGHSAGIDGGDAWDRRPPAAEATSAAGSAFAAVVPVELGLEEARRPENVVPFLPTFAEPVQTRRPESVVKPPLHALAELPCSRHGHSMSEKGVRGAGDGRRPRLAASIPSNP
jgi:hypothetical protein